MGTTTKGVLANVTGKVGMVVASTRNGQTVVKSLPQRKKNAKFSEAQLDQQAKFRTVMDHLQSMSDFIGRTILPTAGTNPGSIQRWLTRSPMR